jgi:hypothetical protein
MDAMGSPNNALLTSEPLQTSSVVAEQVSAARQCVFSALMVGGLFNSDDEFDQFESFAMNHRRPMRAMEPQTVFSQITTKIPPSYDGRQSWFSYEEAIDDWVDITELEIAKHGVALRNRLEGEAAVYRSILDRERLKQDDGVEYFKKSLRPYFVKGAQNVFLYRFMYFVKFARSSHDLLKWLTRFQINLKKLKEAWNDLYVNVTDQADVRIAQWLAAIQQQQQQQLNLAGEVVLQEYNRQMSMRHAQSFPLSDNLIALLMVSLADLTEQQRQTLTSMMAHRSRNLSEYDPREIRELFIELFCTSKTSLENPLLSTGRNDQRPRSFAVIETGWFGESYGHWAIDEDDDVEGFLDEIEDVFWLYDDESQSWFSRKFRGRRMSRYRPLKGKGKGRRRGRQGRRFFRPRKGKGKGKSRRRPKGKGKSYYGGEDDQWNDESYAIEDHDSFYEEDDGFDYDDGWYTEDSWYQGDWYSDVYDSATEWLPHDSYAVKGKKGKGGKKGKKGKLWNDAPASDTPNQSNLAAVSSSTNNNQSVKHVFYTHGGCFTKQEPSFSHLFFKESCTTEQESIFLSFQPSECCSTEQESTSTKCCFPEQVFVESANSECCPTGQGSVSCHFIESCTTGQESTKCQLNYSFMTRSSASIDPPPQLPKTSQQVRDPQMYDDQLILLNDHVNPYFYEPFLNALDVVALSQTSTHFCDAIGTVRFNIQDHWLFTSFTEWPEYYVTPRADELIKTMSNPSSKSFMAEQATKESETSDAFLLKEVAPNLAVLDLGCTRAMVSRVAATYFMEYVDADHTCGITYELLPTESRFNFANSETTCCHEKLRLHFNDRRKLSTDFEIVEQGDVPFLMSLAQMRNLEFQFKLGPKYAILTSAVLGIKDFPLPVGNTGHLLLDLVQLGRWLRRSWYVPKSFFSYSFKADVVSSFCIPEAKNDAFHTDTWELKDDCVIRTHLQWRSRLCLPYHTGCPVDVESLTGERISEIQYKDGTKETVEDNFREGRIVAKHMDKTWKGRTIFKIKQPETTVSERPRTRMRRKKTVRFDEPISEGTSSSSKGLRRSSTEEVREPKDYRSSSPTREEDRSVQHPSLGPEGPAPAGESVPEDISKVLAEPDSLDPRRLALPLPGQEIAIATPAYKRLVERLRNEVELYKLHVKHYHMSATQFRRRTSMLNLPDEIHAKYEKIVRGCHICSAAVLPPSRAKFSGIRATTFGEIIFADHCVIDHSGNKYLVLLILDGATNLLWANVQAAETASETISNMRSWIEDNNCMPKGIVADEKFHTSSFTEFYRFHGIIPYPLGPRTPWPNRAETAVRLFKAQWRIVSRLVGEDQSLKNISIRQLVKKCVWARNCQLTISGYTPLEIATGRRPPDMLDVETSTPEQLTANPDQEDRDMQTLQRIALRAHQEARQLQDLKHDLAKRIRPSEGPFKYNDKVFVWEKDHFRFHDKGKWTRGKVISQDGAIVLVETDGKVVRVNQSKVRLTHDEWHDVPDPLLLPGGNSTELAPEPELRVPEMRARDSTESARPDREIKEMLQEEFFPEESSSMCWLSKDDCVHFTEVFVSSTGLSGLFADRGFNVSTPVDFKHGFSFSSKTKRVKAFQHVLNLSPKFCFISMSHVSCEPTSDKNCHKQEAMINLGLQLTKELAVRSHCSFAVLFRKSQWNDWLFYAFRSYCHNEGFCIVHFALADNRETKDYVLVSNVPQNFVSLFSGHTFTSDIFANLFVQQVSKVLDPQLDVRQSHFVSDLVDGCDMSELVAMSHYGTEEQFHETLTPYSFVVSEKCLFQHPVLVQLLQTVQQLPTGTELALHSDDTELNRRLIPMVQYMRRKCLPKYEFQHCQICRGTLGSKTKISLLPEHAVLLLFTVKEKYVVYFAFPHLVRFERLQVQDWCFIALWNDPDNYVFDRSMTDLHMNPPYMDVPIPTDNSTIPVDMDSTNPSDSGFHDPRPPDSPDVPNVFPPFCPDSPMPPVVPPQPPGDPPQQFGNPDDPAIPPDPPDLPMPGVEQYQIYTPTATGHSGRSRTPVPTRGDISDHYVPERIPHSRPPTPDGGKPVAKARVAPVVSGQSKPIPTDSSVGDDTSSETPGVGSTDPILPILPESVIPYEQIQQHIQDIPEEDGFSEASTIPYDDDDAVYVDASCQRALSAYESVLANTASFTVPDEELLPGVDFYRSFLSQRKKKGVHSEATHKEVRDNARAFRLAKLKEFRSWLDNQSIIFIDSRTNKLANLISGRWVLTFKRDKDNNVTACKARWVARGFLDRQLSNLQTDSPTTTRFGFRLSCQVAASNFWDLFHVDLKTAFLQGEDFDPLRSVCVRLPPDLGLPPYIVGQCRRPVYGLNDAPRRWWNRLDKSLRTWGLQPTRADRCTYVLYEGAWMKPVEITTIKKKSKTLFSESCFAEQESENTLLGCSTEQGSSSRETSSSHLDVDQANICSFGTNVPKTLKMTEYKWLPVIDEELLAFLNSCSIKQGWYPYKDGVANVSYRSKALRSPEPTYKTKDYPFRTSIICRNSFWYIIEVSNDMRKEKNVFLPEEAYTLVSIYMPEYKVFKAEEKLSHLTPELTDELLEYFIDPIAGSNCKGRKVVALINLHVDDLFITCSDDMRERIIGAIRKEYTIGHEDTNDIEFTGQRVVWKKEGGKKQFIRVSQEKSIETLLEVEIPKGLDDNADLDKSLHTEYRSLLGSINWIQSRTQYPYCYAFSRLASASRSPKVSDLKQLNKLCRQIRAQPAELRFWPLKGNLRILVIPDAAYRNNSDKSSQRGQTLFLAEPRSQSKDTRGSLIFYESTKIKRTTLSTTVAELYSLMKAYGTSQLVRGLWKDMSGQTADIHIRTDANNLVTTASTTHVPEQQETIHMIQMLRKEACSGSIDDLAHVKTEDCLADCLTKASANPTALVNAIMSGTLRNIDCHKPFREAVQHKAYLLQWLQSYLPHVPSHVQLCYVGEPLYD